MRSNRFSLVLFVLAGLMVPELAFASTYYVATDGSDANPGSEAKPWKTINRARSEVVAGDTVYIRGGTYVEELAWIGGPSGTSWSNPIRFAAYTGESVTVRPDVGAARALTLINSGTGIDDGSQYLIFEGITFDGRNATYDVVKIAEWDGLVMSQGGFPARHIRFENFRFTSESLDHGQQGILISGSDVQLIRGEIDHIGAGWLGPGQNSQGIYGAADDLLVDGVHVHDIGGYCMSNINSTPGVDANDHTIINNVVHDCLYGGINEGEGTGTVIANNVVFNTPKGIFINDFGAGHSDGIRVLNNTVHDNSEVGIGVTGNTDNTIVRNNVAFGNAEDYHNTRSTTVEDHNLFGVDPLFVDASAHDYRLTAQSPAIDTGDALSEIATDADGIARPQGVAFDRGAFEYCAGECAGTSPGGGAGGGSGSGATGGGTAGNGGSNAGGASAGSGRGGAADGGKSGGGFVTAGSGSVERADDSGGCQLRPRSSRSSFGVCVALGLVVLLRRCFEPNRRPRSP